MTSKVESLKLKAREYQKKAYKLNEQTIRLSKKGVGTVVGNIFTYVVLISLTVIFLAPFVYMLSRSVMSAKDLADSYNVKWLPRSFVFENYSYAFRILDYWRTLARSLVYAGLATLFQVVSCSFVAYGLARIKFRGSGFLFGLVIFALIVPPQTIIVTQYVLYSNMGLVDTAIPFILPCLFSLGLNGGLFTFIFRQFYKGMPAELENAALIDGTGIFGAYFRVIMPNASASILVTSILSFIWHWNDYFEPTIYITDRDAYSLTMMLQNLSSNLSAMGSGVFTNGINLAATFLCALPVIVIFFILQRRFMKGIETTGLAN